MNKFDTHKFLYNLYHEGKTKGHTIIYIDKNNKEQQIQIEDIQIGPSPISCNIYDTNHKKHKILFLRIKQIYYKVQLVWENTDINLEDIKIIKGYKK
jgi:hypothetical protein